MKATRIALSLAQKHGEFLALVQGQGSGSVKITKYGSKIVEILIDNPVKRNCISGRMMGEFASIVDNLHQDIAQDSQLACIVLRGAGMDSFCSGADLQLVNGILNSSEKGTMMSRFMSDLLNGIRDSPLISVCCINGVAVGGGSELATVGDFRIMSSNPKHYLQFIHAKIGAVPGWGGLNRLTSIVGRKEAIRIACGSARVYSEYGTRVGLFDSYFDLKTSEDWLSVAEAYLQPYLEQENRLAVRSIKSSIAAVDILDQEKACGYEMKEFQSRWFSKEHADVMSKSKT